MSRIAVRLIIAAIATAAVACGKKGPPQPPLRPVSAMVGGFAAERIDSTVTLSFTVPAENLDGSKPAAADRVELFAITQPASAPVPTREQLMTPPNLAVTVLLRNERETTPDPAAKPKPGPGERVAHVEQLKLPTTGETLVRYYAAVATGRRRGVASAILAVPIATGPSAPTGVTPEFSEREVSITWQASGAGQRFVVSARGVDGIEKRLTPEPITATRFAQPVSFSAERCFVVRAVDVVGGVTLVGDPAAPACVTPVDRFSPEPPTDLRAVPADAAVILVWTASPSSDVAGYVVLRAEGPNGTLQRLTPSLVNALEYRDATARPGVTYVYAVVAVDGANPPNQSAESNRQSASARRP